MSALDSDKASTPHDTDAARPRRVLVVGEALAAQLQPGIARWAPRATVMSVPSILMAMGEAAHAPADVLITPAEQMAGMAESAAHCLRELLPGARLVVLADEDPRLHEEAEAALRGGFDVQLAEPVDETALRAAIDGQPATSTPEPHETTDRAATPAPDAQPPQEPADASPLGDVDLVETLLTARDRLTATALKLLTQRSGIAGLGWAQHPEDVPAAHGSAPVRCQGRSFGLLHAPSPVTDADLAPWAAWLSRWMALHAQMSELETLAMRDELTGAWNRRYFNRFLERIIEQAVEDRSQVTLLVFDIDDFKLYNDRYGHAAGDEILREAARLMQSFVREHDVVARIGGDEFAVIFWDAEQKRKPDSEHPQTVRQAARRFQEAICAHRFPKLLHEAPGTLTISGGLASFPWDGRSPNELLDRADAMAMQSKRQGKNAITFGPGALRACQPNLHE
ncbi:MAG: GGDEF domain-containing protein [Phycisphaeraceae bacterium]